MGFIPDWFVTWAEKFHALAGSAALVVSLVLNLVTMYLFLRSRMSDLHLFAGQWRGSLYCGRGTVECTASFYIEHGALAGWLYYSGQYDDQHVRGVDRLENQQDWFVKTQRKSFLHPFRGRFSVKFERRMHIFHEKGHQNLTDMSLEYYNYDFLICRRFFNPRFACKVKTKADSEGDVYDFSGELAKT